MFGGFTSNVDMKSGAPAFGTPEYVKATLAGGQIARRFSNEELQRRWLRVQGRSVRPAGVHLESRAWFNENLESRNFFSPG
jgi:hypothetical protein